MTGYMRKEAQPKNKKIKIMEKMRTSDLSENPFYLM